MSTLQIADLKREPELQCRAKGINAATVREYGEAMKAGATFPPVVVFHDGKGAHWLADGFHRVAAAELAGVAEIAVDVREGDRKAALLHAASANSDHGLRRTLADKRAAVQRLLAAYPKWSDRKIAEAAKVDHKTVGAARKAVAAPEGGEFPTAGDAPPNDAGPTEAAPAHDLGAAYLEVASAHKARSADEHREAFESALALAFAPGPTRRRIVQPKGEAATANGGE